MELPFRAYDHKLTGRVRFRASWRGKMIAQVEVSYMWSQSPFSRLDATSHTVWRDATMFDVQALGPIATLQ